LKTSLFMRQAGFTKNKNDPSLVFHNYIDIILLLKMINTFDNSTLFKVDKNKITFDCFDPLWSFNWTKHLWPCKPKQLNLTLEWKRKTCMARKMLIVWKKTLLIHFTSQTITINATLNNTSCTHTHTHTHNTCYIQEGNKKDWEGRGTL